MFRILLTGVLFGAGYKFGTEYVYPWLKSVCKDVREDIEAAKETVEERHEDDVQPVDDK
jgi:hypothetical protein